MTTKAERDARDAKALDLRRAGVAVPKIASQQGYSTTAAAEAGIARAMKAAAVVSDPVAIRDLELDRLDRLQQAVWVKALAGDTGAQDRVMRLSEMRMRLAGTAGEDATPLSDAFEVSLAAVTVTDADAALVAAGRRVAARIDAAAQQTDLQAETKALYLLPHLMSILRELGATPAARDVVGTVVQQPAGANDREDDLARFKLKKGSA